MKKLLFAMTLACCAAAWAEEEKPAGKEEREAPPPEREAEMLKADWPVPFAFTAMDDIDVVGFRFTVPWQTTCESVTGFDIGLFGRCRYFEGIQLSLLRNDVKDTLAGIQVGLYNSVGRAELFGMQVGLFNEAHSLCGMQIGLVNIMDAGSGIQVGLINRAESVYGFQVGGVNVMRESQLAFFPVINIGLDYYTNP